MRSSRRILQAVIETLSPRCLLSVALENGVLHVVGTESDDRICIAANRNLINVITVDLNGAVWHATRAAVKSLQIESLGGADQIRVDSSLDQRAFPSLINAGSGSDRIFTGAGKDTILAGAGNDRVGSEAGDDSIIAGAGNDSIRSGTGVDFVYGDEGSDKLWGENVWGGPGADKIYGTDGADWLHGGDGDDLLLGRAGNDQIFGDAGGDAIYGGAGYDTLHGGEDNDNLYGSDGFEDKDRSDDGRDVGYGDEGKDWFEPTHNWASIDSADAKQQVKLGQDFSYGQYGLISTGILDTGTGIKLGSATLNGSILLRAGTPLKSLGDSGFLFSGSEPSPLSKAERTAMTPTFVQLPQGCKLGAMTTAKDDVVWYHLRNSTEGYYEHDRYVSALNPRLVLDDPANPYHVYNYLAVHRGTILLSDNVSSLQHHPFNEMRDYLPKAATLRVAGEEQAHRIVELSNINPVLPSKDAHGILVEDGAVWLNVGAYPYFSDALM